MSDDTLEIFENHPFHPTDPPHGLRNFDLGTLGKDQQRMLNRMKMKQRMDNEVYLAAHPEVRGLISILLRHLLSMKPEHDIHENIGSFFNKPRANLIRDLLDYFTDTDYSGPIVDNLRNEIARTSALIATPSNLFYTSSSTCSESTN